MRKIDLGIKVDTDKEKIAEFLNNQNSKNKIVITTYQSGQSLIDGIRLANNFSFDFGIFDEAHKTAGDKNKSFAKLLHDENVLVQKRLFMTATERVYKGDSDKIISMDDEEIYGKVIHQLSFKSALEQDPPVLSKYKIVTNRVSKKYIQDLINENKLVRANNKQWSYDADCSTFASLISLRQLVKQENLKHVVSFHSSIPRSKEFKLLNDQLNNFSSEFGTLHTSQISGKDSSGVRTKLLSEFKSFEPSLITNARCLTEGVDIPVIDAVLFADPKNSTVDIVQAAGRAMRRCEGKEYGYIIVPIIVDEDEEGSIHKDSFKQIINVISAMGMNDDRIIAEFQALVFKQTRETNICDFDFESVAESINLKDFYLNIQNKVWDRLSFAKSFIDESTFANWMRTATTLSEKSIKNYVGGVNTITNGLIKMRPEYKNIDDLIKSEDLSLLKKEWMSIEENLALDTRGNGMYSAGFNKLIEYANYKKMIKD
jgi:predicted helicase